MFFVKTHSKRTGVTADIKIDKNKFYFYVEPVVAKVESNQQQSTSVVKEPQSAEKRSPRKTPTPKKSFKKKSKPAKLGSSLTKNKPQRLNKQLHLDEEVDVLLQPNVL